MAMRTVIKYGTRKRYAVRGAGRVVRRRLMKTGGRMALRSGLGYAGLGLAAAGVGYGAYKGIRRWRRARARARVRRSIGQSYRMGPKHLTPVANSAVQNNSRTLNGNHELTPITQGTDEGNREYQEANILGWRIYMGFYNNSDFHLVVNVALLSPKDVTATSIDTAGFFRNYGNRREMDFDANTRDSMEFNLFPINTDKYRVLQRWRYDIGPQQEDGNPAQYAGNVHQHMLTKKWVPFRRQIRYENTGNAPTNGKVFIVHWCDQKTNQAAGTATVSNAYLSQLKILTFFRDSK